MKYLSDYTEAKTKECLKKHHAFFAFSTKQFEEQREEQFKGEYMNMGAGLILPSQFAESFVTEYENIINEGIAQDMKENGKEAIIRRELFNHEVGITLDTEPTEDALADYPILPEEIRDYFKKHWREFPNG